MHGTAIAGAIAAHQKLVGVAPKVRLLAVRAFSGSGESAQGTTYNILKGLDWAAGQNARIVNMSFAGPADAMMRDMLAKAYARGIVLIAAVGNAGPKSPPLYPAAYQWRDWSDRDRRERQAAAAGQPRRAGDGRGARRRHPRAGAERRLSGDLWNLDRRGACERRCSPVAGARPEAFARGLAARAHPLRAMRFPARGATSAPASSTHFQPSMNSPDSRDYRKYWSGRRDLNPRPLVSQTSALTGLRYAPTGTARTIGMRLPWRNLGREAERFAQRVKDVEGGAHDIDGGVAADEVDDVERRPARPPPSLPPSASPARSQRGRFREKIRCARAGCSRRSEPGLPAA